MRTPVQELLDEIHNAIDEAKGLKTHTGVERLLFAVLEETWMELSPAKGDLYRKFPQDKLRQIRRWLMSNNSDWIFSFDFICDHFKLPKAKLRRKLFQMANRV